MTQQQPIYIMQEGTTRTTGREAQRNNILAAKLVAETVRTTLGPKGMDKMLVDSMGDIIVTNDGVTILREMHIEHPAAKMIVEIAKTQENEVGDGTTTAVIFAGELLKNAENLLNKEVHPTVIIKGYRLAAQKALEVLENIAEKKVNKERKILIEIAQTAMTGKGAESAKEQLAEITVNAIQQVLIEENGKVLVDPEDIKFEKKVGHAIQETELIQGIVLDKEKVHSAMPHKVAQAKILLTDVALEVKSTEIDAKIQINDPAQMQAYLDMEERMLKTMVEKIKRSQATVVIAQKGIDDLIQHYLAKEKIYACRRVKRSDMEKLAKATGAHIVSNLDEITSEDIGFAATVEERHVGDEDMTFIEGCKNAKAVTIMVRGGTTHVVDEVERALKDAVGDLIAVVKDGKVVGGAGSCELEVAKEIRTFAISFSGREQLAISMFADALEVIPTTLAENAGLDPIDTLTELKAAHDKGEKWAGLDVFTGKVMNAYQRGIVEPFKVKTQAIQSAAEVTELILRIDDVLAAGKPKQEAPKMPDME